MKLLFLCGVFDKDMEKIILEKSKSTVQYAANKLQWNFIDGLFEIKNIDLEVLSATLIGSFPRGYSKIRIKGKRTYYKDSIKCNYVKFNNIWGYRNISRKNNLIKNIKEFALDGARNKSIIVYSPHTPYLQAAVYAKRKDPSIHICLIVPDLPQFMNLNEKRSFVYDSLKKIDIDIFNKNSQYVDSFVLLTKSMKNMLSIGKRPYTVIEGVVNIESDNSYETRSTNNIKTVVYTGTLNKKFGVVNLVKAFHELNFEDISLIICGRGDSEEILKAYALKDRRIKLLGQLSNEEAVKLQKEATVLVNPRQNNEEFTKYSFPSKNLEYLLTGNPVIAYKLDGIPDEYDDYFYYIEDDTINSFARKIQEILLMTDRERTEFGERARSFILKNKNNIVAAKRVINMIEKNRSR